MEAARNLQLEKAILTIAFIGQKKDDWKTRGIKDTEGNWWNVAESEVASLRSGQTYHVEFWRNDKGYRTIENIVPAAVAKPQQQQQRSKTVEQGEYNRETHPRDAQRMFVAKILGDFIQTGRVNDDVATLTRAVNDLRQVWRDTFGLDENV